MDRIEGNIYHDIGSSYTKGIFESGEVQEEGEGQGTLAARGEVVEEEKGSGAISFPNPIQPNLSFHPFFGKVWRMTW